MARSTLIASVVALVGLVMSTLTIVALVDALHVQFFVAALIAIAFGLAIAIALMKAARQRRWCSNRLAPMLAVIMVAIPTLPPLTMVLLYQPTEAVAKPSSRRPATKVVLSTGSRIGVWKLPAQTGSARGTVIHLHGGPGMYTPNIRFEQAATFQRQGFDAVLFDQAGGGASDRLSVDQYTVTRAVADVEALRAQLGVDRVVLWGSSWGVPLAVKYAEAHPDHVAGMILLSPGAYPGTKPNRDYSVTASNGDLPSSPRLLAHHLLINIDPSLAEGLASQSTAGRWMDEQFADAAGRFECKGDTSGTTAMATEFTGGANPFANALLAADLANTNAPSSVAVRSLIARGSCDFIPASNAARFGQLLSTDVMTIENQGHGLRFDTKLTEAISNFLQTIPAN